MSYEKSVPEFHSYLKEFTVFVLIEKLVFTVKNLLFYFASDQIWNFFHLIWLIIVNCKQVQAFIIFTFKPASSMENGSCQEERLRNYKSF